jgi:hypothetical protein
MLVATTKVKGIKWQSQVLCLELITGLSESAPRQTERALPLLIPASTGSAGTSRATAS